MTTPTSPVDAGTQAPAQTPQAPQEGGTQAPSEGVDFYKSEAQKAFEKRDAANARVRELEAQLAERDAADAARQKQAAVDSGDLAKQLELEREERQKATAQLTELKQSRRKDQILNQLTAGVPAESRDAVRLLFDSQASTLDDGTAEPGEVAKKAEAYLKQLAPQLFKPATAPRVGRLPQDGGTPGWNAEAERKKQDEAFTKQFPGQRRLL